MIGQLEPLLAIRQVRLQSLQAELGRRMTRLARIDEEIDAVDRELAQIAEQRTIWENAWRYWQRDDRLLRHGQDYNLTHVALSAWERDTRQLREEVCARREEAAAEVREMRVQVLAMLAKVDALREQLEEMRGRERARRAALLDSRVHDDVTSHACSRVPAVGAFEGA